MPIQFVGGLGLAKPHVPVHEEPPPPSWSGSPDLLRSATWARASSDSRGSSRRPCSSRPAVQHNSLDGRARVRQGAILVRVRIACADAQMPRRSDPSTIAAGSVAPPAPTSIRRRSSRTLAGHGGRLSESSMTKAPRPGAVAPTKSRLRQPDLRRRPRGSRRRPLLHARYGSRCARIHARGASSALGDLVLLGNDLWNLGLCVLVDRQPVPVAHSADHGGADAAGLSIVNHDVDHQAPRGHAKAMERLVPQRPWSRDPRRLAGVQAGVWILNNVPVPVLTLAIGIMVCIYALYDVQPATGAIRKFVGPKTAPGRRHRRRHRRVTAFPGLAVVMWTGLRDITRRRRAPSCSPSSCSCSSRRSSQSACRTRPGSAKPIQRCSR